MTNTNGNILIEITKREKAEFEKMLGILKRKQKAISGLDSDQIQKIVGEELDQLKKIHGVEDERVAFVKSIGLSSKDLADSAAVGSAIGSELSEAYSSLHSDFKELFDEVVRLNNATNLLLVHSIAFIKKNIQILTDNGKRQLVDKKA